MKPYLNIMKGAYLAIEPHKKTFLHSVMDVGLVYEHMYMARRQGHFCDLRKDWRSYQKSVWGSEGIISHNILIHDQLQEESVAASIWILFEDGDSDGLIPACIVTSHE